jgi:hypothetical protein
MTAQRVLSKLLDNRDKRKVRLWRGEVAERLGMKPVNTNQAMIVRKPDDEAIAPSTLPSPPEGVK